jgi:NADH-quinone oxidoreductase subunit N
MVIGFAFKVAAVPLHAWAPPTYEGAPLPVAAYLSTASKLGGVLALAAIVSRLDAAAVTAALAVLTMTVGNLVALRQDRMVRLLAWSSIAQAGYILAALTVGASGVQAALVYAVFFMILEFIAFAAVVALRPPASDGGDMLAYRGAARRSPWLGAALVLAFAGLAGLPPGLAGLFAKVTVVDVLIDQGWGWLAAVVALNAVIGLAYYVRATTNLYATPPRPGIQIADPALLEAATHPRLPVARPVAAARIAAAVAAVVLGFAPQLLFNALT